MRKRSAKDNRGNAGSRCETSLLKSGVSSIERVISQVNPNEVAKLACDLVSIPSPPGHESHLGEFVLGYFNSIGLETVRQVLGEDRINAIGILRGKGSGLSLTLNGHLDSSLAGYSSKLSPDSPELKPNAYVKDGEVHGPGIANMKGGLAALMAAAKALKNSGVELKGDVYFVTASGETSRAPVDEFFGQECEGGGYGTRYAVARGMVTDYAICCDGSNLKLSKVQAGVVFVKITTSGHAVYAPFVERDWNGRQSISALAKMMPILAAIEDWAYQYEEKNRTDYDGFVVAPRVCIGSIRAGVPFKPSMTPSSCSIYVDVRTLPEVPPGDIEQEIKEVVERIGVPAEVRMFRSQLGHLSKGADDLVAIVSQAHELLFRKPLEKAGSAYNSMWTDTNVYNEIGVPCIKLGPSPAKGENPKPYTSHVTGVPLALDDIVNAAKLYAVTALELCNTQKKPA